MATVLCSGWAGGNDPPSPGGRVCPRGGASRPAGPSLQSPLVQFIHLLFPGSWMQIAPPGKMRGRGGVDSLPLKLRTGYAPLAPPPGPPALQCSRPNRSLPSFRRLPCGIPRPRDPPRMAYGCTSPPARWAHAPHATPRGWAGVGLLERWRSWVMESFRPFRFVRAKRAHAGSGKQKIAPPMSLPSCAMRCIVGSPPAATSGFGARVTSGRDSRESQSVKGGLRVVNPPARSPSFGLLLLVRGAASFSTAPDRRPSPGNPRP